MKCSVCAQDVPEDGYAEHLESEHGVTDDPTAVLIQHLTGLHSRDADDVEADDADALPDEEPGDADAFGEFFTARADDDGDEESEVDEHADDAQDEDADAAVAHEDDLPEDEHVAEEDEQLTDDDEAEFERMLATYPDVDLRKGRPAPPASEESEEEVEPTERVLAATAAGAAGAAAGAAAASDLDSHDEKTFAVWDEARGAADGDELPFAAPDVEDERSRRRRRAALVGLAAAIVLVAIAVGYLLTRDTSSKKTVTSPSTVATTTAPTFLPGPANGAPTTVPATTPPTQPPVTSAPATPATTAAPTATTATPSGDPRSQISFPSMRGACSNGQLSVAGTVVNNNPQTYSFSFTITFANSSGGVLGTANGSVAHMPARSTGPFSASGSCSNVNGAASKTVQITSITPG